MACSPLQRSKQDFIELGRLMKALGSQLANSPQSSKSGGAETAELRKQRASWRSTAKELFKHLKQTNTDTPTADQPPGASDGSLFGAPSPPSVVPAVPSNGGEVAGGAPAVVHEGAQPMEHTVAVGPGAGPPSAAQGEPVPALSLNGQAEAAGAEARKLSLPKDVERRPGSKDLSAFAGADKALASALPASKDGTSDGVDGSQVAPTSSGTDSLPHIPKRQPLRSPAAADKPPPPVPAVASRASGGSPPTGRGNQPSGLLLPRRQQPALPGAIASESPPRRTASPRAPTSPRQLLSPRPPAPPRLPPGPPPPPRAQPQVGGRTGSVHEPDQPRARLSLLSPRDANARAGGAHPLKTIGGSVYDAITEDTGLHEYKPLTPVRGVLRSAFERRGGQRSVSFGVDKAWILPPLSPGASPARDAAAASPARDADEAVLDEDDDGGSGVVGLAFKVRNKDVESEAKHFRARHVAHENPAVDALLTLTLQRAFEYFSNNPNFLPDPTPAQLWELMRDISGSIDLADMKHM